MLKCLSDNSGGIRESVPLSTLAAQTQPGTAAQVFRVGRHPDNELVLDDPDFPLLISRRHAECVCSSTTSHILGSVFDVLPMLHLKPFDCGLLVDLCCFMRAAYPSSMACCLSGIAEALMERKQSAYHSLGVVEGVRDIHSYM